MHGFYKRVELQAHLKTQTEKENFTKEYVF